LRLGENSVKRSEVSEMKREEVRWSSDDRGRKANYSEHQL
jgi:hypothetical protein